MIFFISFWIDGVFNALKMTLSYSSLTCRVCLRIYFVYWSNSAELSCSFFLSLAINISSCTCRHCATFWELKSCSSSCAILAYPDFRRREFLFELNELRYREGLNFDGVETECSFSRSFSWIFLPKESTLLIFLCCWRNSCQELALIFLIPGLLPSTGDFEFLLRPDITARFFEKLPNYSLPFEEGVRLRLQIRNFIFLFESNFSALLESHSFFSTSC